MIPGSIEEQQPSDTLYSYCLWPYEPVAPVEHKWRSSTLLLHSFAHAQVGERAGAMLAAIREAMGIGNTVWGIKQAGGALSWELYFYDYARRERQRSATRLLHAVRPFARSAIVPNEALHYFMFSVDLDDALFAGRRDIDEIHMYIGNVGSKVSSGISYSVTPDATALENFYFFFDPAQHFADIAAKVSCSAFLDAPHVPVESILWPELLSCRTICIANKRHNDCVYYSGVNIDQFLWAIDRLAFPEPLTRFVRDNRSRLDHLLFDVGIDYRVHRGEVQILKSAYYGHF